MGNQDSLKFPQQAKDARMPPKRCRQPWQTSDLTRSCYFTTVLRPLEEDVVRALYEDKKKLAIRP